MRPQLTRHKHEIKSYEILYGHNVKYNKHDEFHERKCLVSQTRRYDLLAVSKESQRNNRATFTIAQIQLTAYKLTKFISR